jgi:undecaprenyl-diphosphatase
MPLYQVIILAIVQGLTEFLPISSTAHLVLFPWFFHWKDPGLVFDVALHAGTLVAVAAYFWRHWWGMLTILLGKVSPVDSDLQISPRLFWFLVMATLPAGIAGWFLEHAAEEQFRQPLIIGTALIVVGLLMWAGDRLEPRKLTLHQISLVDSILIGVAQAFAIIPGVSRSGSTMTAGLFRGISREAAARFSFLLSTPIIAGATLKAGVDLLCAGVPPEMRVSLLVGISVSAVVGYLAIAALIRYLERRSFQIFIVYRVALGVLVLALGWGMRHPLG